MDDLNRMSGGGPTTESSYVIHINSIPDAVLLDIFSKLSFSELCICSRVCHRWLTLAKDFTLRKRVIVKKSLRPHQFSSLVQHHFTSLLEEFQLLKVSEEKTLMPMKKDMLWKLSNLSSSLKKLVLMSCSLSLVSLEDLPSSLTHLSVRGSEIYPDLFFKRNPQLFVPHLVCLDIGGVSNFLTSQDLHFISNMKSLRALYLEGCFRINNGGIESIVDILPQLVVLDVEGTDISNEGAVTIFMNCSNMKNLFIGHTLVDDAALSRIKGNTMPSLSSLCVRSTNISSMGLHSFLLSRLSSKKLHVSANFNYSDSCKCFDREETPCPAMLVMDNTSFTIGTAFPFTIGTECHHYLSQKLYGLN